ncbi:MAG TPA: metalloregulator ArsR/SmtB family transcription factor [Candidatus Acidoferrales bacterium]|nr:metalloregulator ArsR/SmtB family transcription factor [Candidatus Acidoferrales bacterium]
MTYSPKELTAIADPTRQAMLQRLRKRPMTVGELAEGLPVTRPAVSQHLKILRQARLVTERREGTRHYFNLNPEALLELRAYIDRMWEDALGAFSRYVADQKRKRKKLGK